MMHLVHLVTNLGDSALLVPASAVLLAYLLYVRSGRTAGIWATTLVLCACLTIVAKLALYTCGAELSLADLRSPSGHTSLSVTFYGCCALMVGADKDPSIRWLLVLGSVATALAIAVSRVLLQAHTIGDVAAGFAIGVLCVAWFSSLYFARPASPMRWELALVTFSLVALLMYGRHWTLEGAIAHFARLLHANMQVCV
jgi:membrane-associated phospholipid phosphatase